MVRRVSGVRHGRVLPGLGAALVERFQELDRAYHRDVGCHWCAQVAELKSGRPTVVDTGQMHRYLEHEEFDCSGPWRHDDRGSFLVTGDRWERLPD